MNNVRIHAFAAAALLVTGAVTSAFGQDGEIPRKRVEAVRVPTAQSPSTGSG
jgi:hypothetical protein